MRFVEDLDVERKTVLLRCDFNVTIINGEIKDDEKIRASLETIKYLLGKGCKIIIQSHIESKETDSLAIVHQRLQELLDGETVSFCEATSGPVLSAAVDALDYGQIVLMENTRREPGEKTCEAALVKEWGSLCDVYVMDAFGTTHRQHASTSGLLLSKESGFGKLVRKEVKSLSTLLAPEEPFVVVMGGAKVDDKMKQFKFLLEKADKLIAGGGILNTILKILGKQVGTSLVSTDPKIIADVTALYAQHEEKIIMPIDVVVETQDKQKVVKTIDEVEETDCILDIGPATIALYGSHIITAQAGFINGTVGYYDKPNDDRFGDGTQSVLQTCADNGTFVVGGGDALASAHYYGFTEEDFAISTGGGAALDFLIRGDGTFACQATPAQKVEKAQA